MTKAGDVAPEFDAPTADGKHITLSSLRGHPVILYFYPEADTPGCTLESKGFRDLYPELQAKKIQVVGVSTDAVDKQCAFAEKYGLPFPLVADHSKEVATAYGVLKPGGDARRVTFFIEPDGTIGEVGEFAKAGQHVDRAKAKYLA